MASRIPSYLCLCRLPAHSSTPTVLCVHPHFNRAASPSLSSFVARASLFVKNKPDAHDSRPLPSNPRIASPSSSSTAEPPQSAMAPGLWWPPEGTRTHKHSGLPRMCMSHPHPCFAMPFAFSLAHHPPPTSAYVLLWCRVSSFLSLHTFAYAHVPPAVHPRNKIARAVPAFAKGECVRFARNPRETKERDL